MSGSGQVSGRINERRYDLVLLDMNTDALELVKKLRDAGDLTPVIMLGGAKDRDGILAALNIGADECITEPLDPAIACAKIKALIRRSRDFRERRTPGNLAAGPFVYDISMLRLYKSGREIMLTSKENAIVKLFMDNPNRIFSKTLIYEMVWGEYITDENAVMVYINRIRRKIEDDPQHPKFIRSVRGLGYRFVVA